MTFLQAIERQVSPAIRSRGWEYFRRGAAQLMDVK
jgi:hypothetical protein